MERKRKQKNPADEHGSGSEELRASGTSKKLTTREIALQEPNEPGPSRKRARPASKLPPESVPDLSELATDPSKSESESQDEQSTLSRKERNTISKRKSRSNAQYKEQERQSKANRRRTHDSESEVEVLVHHSTTDPSNSESESMLDNTKLSRKERNTLSKRKSRLNPKYKEIERKGKAKQRKKVSSRSTDSETEIENASGPSNPLRGPSQIDSASGPSNSESESILDLENLVEASTLDTSNSETEGEFQGDLILTDKSALSRKEKKTESMRKSRANPEYQKRERQSNAKRIADLRKNPSYRIKEKSAQVVTQNTEKRRQNKAKQMADLRKNTSYRMKEKSARVMRRQLATRNTKLKDLIRTFEEAVREGPTYICSCCGGLFYKKSVNEVSIKGLTETWLCKHKEKSATVEELLPYRPTKAIWLCTTCRTDIHQGRIPHLALFNGFKFPEVNETLSTLTNLEERLVALRVPFMQMKILGSDGQYGLKGGVVNVPNNLDISVNSLPRQLHDTSTIHVQLMRRMCYNIPYIFETVRPNKVYEAAKYLIDKSAYKNEGVQLNHGWIEEHQGAEEVCIIQEPLVAADITGSELTNQLQDESILSNVTQQQNRPEEEASVPANSLSIEGSDDEGDEFSSTRLNPGGDETLILETEDTSLNNYIIKIAPAEHMNPISALQDKQCEAKSFPKIYGGEEREFKIKVSHVDIAKSEARMYDRRACNPTKLLYSCKLSQIELINKSITLCLRQRSKPDSLTAQAVTRDQLVAELVSRDDGYHCLKEIRGSPPYFQEQQRKVMAMIRQLGLPTFFITLSAAETKWTELIVNLEKIVNGKTISEEQAADMAKNNFSEVCKLIRADPITCARNFEHRYTNLLSHLFKKKGGIFSPSSVSEYYQRVEFQHRGSPHSHGMYWIEGAPVYEPDEESSHDNSEECVQFIDTYITTKRFIEAGVEGMTTEEKERQEEMLKLQAYQLHKCTKSCKKQTKKGFICRFGFPLPPMKETVILGPLDSKNTNFKTALANYTRIQDTLILYGRDFEGDIPMDTFLQSLDLSYEEYILAIRSSLNRHKVFLKRSTNAAFINAYNETLLRTWRANLDIQYIIDPYACAKYCVNYINKSAGGVSRMLKEVRNQMLDGNLTLRDRLRKYGHVFLNSSEISAQEAAYFVLGLPYTQCSRECVFINTGSPETRIFVVKSAEELNKLPPESTDIGVKGLLDRYKIRLVDKKGNDLEKCCLADFAAWYNIPSYSRRRKPRIIRYCGYSIAKDPENYYREQLMLYIPWRDEKLELMDIDVKSRYEANRSVIEEKRAEYIYSSELEAIEYAPDPSISTNNDENTPQLYDEENLEEDVFGPRWASSNYQRPPPPPENEEETHHRQSNHQVEFVAPSYIISEELYREKVLSLNENQQKYFLHIIHNLKNCKTDFHEFLSGGAGVGKSHEITAIVQTAVRYYTKKPGANPDSAYVIICASTGKAAFNVNGVTLHSAFRLPITKGPMYRLDDSSCNSLRTKLLDLKLIIIDEISMASLTHLYNINNRLQQIFQRRCPFGGIPILVVGDFLQLRPVADNFVFEKPKLIHSHIPVNTLWELFRMFELTEIMRQKDDKIFAVCLNNMAKGCMTDEDINLMKSREIRPDLQPPDNAIRLFHTRQECSDYNKIVHRRLTTESATSYAHDNVQGGTAEERIRILNLIKPLDVNQAEGLIYRLELKLEAIYMIPINIDIQDGLFNGATGILKHIEYAPDDVNKKIPIRVYIEFPEQRIGAKKRLKYRFHQQQHGINTNWTPLEFEKRPIRKAVSHMSAKVYRRQFPLMAADGMTINKAQGSSFKTMVLRLTSGIRRDLLYSGCSRSFTSDGLYLDGNFIAPGPPPAYILKELKRLRNLPIQLSIQFLQDYPPSSLKIIFHNVESLHRYHADVNADRCFMAADVIALVEPHTDPGATYTFSNFNCISRHDPENKKSSYGSFLLGKERVQDHMRNITFNSSSSSTGHIDLTTFALFGITFVIVYRSPSSKVTDFRKILSEKLLKHREENIVVVGDMNMDINKADIRTSLSDLFEEAKLTLKLPYESSTDGGSQIDTCYSNLPDINCWYYESVFSYHKPICIIVPDKF